MTIDQERLRELFIEACDLSAAEQTVFIDKNCANDQELRAELQRLLQSDGTQGGILADDHMAEKIQAPFDLVGQTIDKYKLLQEIGEGGFGIVYMAQQVTPVKRKVALKVIKPGMDTRDALARFEAERQALALMEHPNICRVLDAGSTESGRPYFVMELVRGVPITGYCSKQNIPVDERLRLFQTVCQAVQHAHAKGIIHRDLKPSNVMITLHDTIPVPKIIDFGISKALNQQLTEKTLFTRYGQMLGTPMYMSPEQAELSGLDIDIRSDVYSLGVLMYELLTGTPPFSAERLQTAAYADMIRIISEEDPPTPSMRLSSLSSSNKLSEGESKIDYRQLSIQVRGDLDRIVMKALEKDRSRRYDTVNDLARDIERFMNDEPVSAGSPTMAYRFRKFVRRNKALVTSASAVFAALSLGLVVSTIGFINARTANNRAKSALLDVQIQRNRAVKEEKNTKAALDSEREQRERVEASLYFQRISRAQREQSSNNLETAARVLEECPVNLRGWEWNYLKNVSRTKLLTLEGMSLPGITTAYSPDGKYIAAGCYRWQDRNCVGELIVWDSQSGKEVWRIDREKGGVSGIAFSPDGKQIATSNGNGGGVSVRDAKSGAKTFDCARRKFYAVQYSPTEPMIAAAGSDQVVRLFDSTNGKTIKELPGHASWISGLGFSPDGGMLATTSHSGELIVWNVDTGDVIAEFENSGNRCARFSPDGKLLATCGYGKGKNGGVFVYEIGESISQVASHRTNFGSVTRLEFSPDSQHIVLNGHGGAIRIWEPVSGQEISVIPAHTQRVNHACFSPDGRYIVSSGNDKLVKTWGLSVAPPPVLKRLDRSFVHGFAFHPNGDVALGGGRNLSSKGVGEQSVTVMRIHEKSQPAMIQKFLGAQQWITSVDYNSDGSLLAAVGSEGRVCIWESEAIDTSGDTPVVIPKTKFEIQTHAGSANSVAFGPTGSKLVSGGSDGKLTIVDVKKGLVERQFANHKRAVNCVDFHPKKNVVVSASADKTLKVWDAVSGKQLQALLDHNSAVTQVVFSPDGQSCASGDETGNVTLWFVDFKAGKESFSKVTTIHCHNDRITGISFSPDQRRLATIGNDGTVAVWDLKTFQEAIRLIPYEENSHFYLTGFSPDGNRLLAARANILTIWNSSFTKAEDVDETSTTEDLVSWHQHQIERCRYSGNWFGVVFHTDRLIKLEPDNHAHYTMHAVANASRNRLDLAMADLTQARTSGKASEMKGLSAVSVGLTNALSNFQLGDIAGARDSFEQAAWRWEQIQAPNSNASPTDPQIRAEIEDRLSDAMDMFAKEQQTGSFAEDRWTNLSTDHRESVGSLLNKLEASEFERNWMEAVDLLDQLIEIRPRYWGYYFQRGKARSRLASVDDQEALDAMAKTDLKQAVQLRTTSTGSDDRFQGGLIVDGTEVVTAAGFPFDKHKQYTVEGWIYGDWQGPLVCQRSPDNNHLFHLYPTSGSFKKRSGGKPQEEFGWDHFALVCDGKTNKFYFNGRLTGSNKANDMSGLRTNGSLMLGAVAYGSRFRLAQGVLHSIRFSSSARYSGEFTPPHDLEADEETILCFKFDESANLNEQVLDLSGNGNNGRFIGAWEVD